MTGFYEMSAEVAAASADLYRVNSPRYACPCGYYTFDGNEHSWHRTGGSKGAFAHEGREAAGGCQATWTKAMS